MVLSPSLLMTEWYSTVSMYCVSFIHPSVDGHVCCFHVLTVLSIAAVNVSVHVSFQIIFLSRCMSRIELVDHMVTLLLVFHGTAITFFIVTVSICIPTESARVFPFFHTPSFIVCRFGDDDHSGWCEVIPHCTFHLHFSDY